MARRTVTVTAVTATLDAPAEAAAHLRRALELSRASANPEPRFEIEGMLRQV